MTAAPQPRRAGLSWALLLASLLVLAALLALGTWQVQRLQWKEGLIARIEARIAAAPVSLDRIETLHAEGGDIDYRPVRLDGTYDHAGERHYFATWRGQSGFYVHTPLRLEDGRFLFVNRGFVPYDRKEAATRPQGQTVGGVRITGLARAAPPEKPSFIVPDNEPGKNLFYWKDLEAMAASAGLPERSEVLPFFVDADDTANPGGLPVGGVTRINLPNNHLQYAITWYGLALALCVVLFVWWRRNGTRS